jgi:glycine/D-amino acid oxidase-like deaminating enzyme
MAQGETPAKSSYDVVIIGGAIMGSATAWFLTENPDFDGRILVVERDPTYQFAASTLSNSSIRQQFSSELNIRISQFGAEFIKSFPARLGNDPRVPEIRILNFGYLYLADDPAFADHLRAAQKIQNALGTPTRILSRDEIAAAWPFYALDDVILGSINTKDEGYFDGGTLFEWFRRSARERGAEYVKNEVVAMTKNAAGTRIDSVTLQSGEVIACGQVVNASGTRGAQTAAMAGIDLPIEPRRRFTWVFKAEKPLDRDLPLTIDPSGVHMRQDGPETYLVGCKPVVDDAADPDDFRMDHDLWQEVVWPQIATRIPQFEAIRIVNEWTGQYDYNTLDQNAVVGPHPEITNFLFLNGFSGHGLQQSPAMGRATAEWLTYGAFRSLDFTPFSYSRVLRGEPYREAAII